jgi:hypothetical protein
MIWVGGQMTAFFYVQHIHVLLPRLGLRAKTLLAFLWRAIPGRRPACRRYATLKIAPVNFFAWKKRLQPWS